VGTSQIVGEEHMKRLVPYRLKIEARRAQRRLVDLPHRRALARERIDDPERYPSMLVTHSSKLIRNVQPQWMRLQENKVRNLELACARVDRLLVRPGEVFSFCETVGRTTRHKGYLDGLEMHGGALVGAPGGGLCQLSNLLFWMALQLDLEIVERHRHEEDLFPDDERSVPFGMGATVFHNYIDLRFRNCLDAPLLLRAGVRRPLLHGAFLSDRPKTFEVEIRETEHRFVRRADGSVWRENRVAKRVTYRDGRPALEREIAHNAGQVWYDVPEERIEGTARPGG
jgi:vancomycin resistance protein VanW